MTSALDEAAVPRPRALDADRWVVVVSFLVPVVCLAVFFLYPLAMVVLRSVTEADGALGLGNYRQVLAGRSFWRSAIHSAVVGGATTLLAVALGFLVAYAVHRCRVPGRGLIVAAVALPLVAPSLVQGLGLIFLFGRNGLVSRALGVELEIYGFPGLLLANTLYALPQAALIIGAALRTADARIYEAAEVLGTSAWRQLVDITLPHVKFGLLSAGFVVFTVTITDFGNAATIGGDYGVLATEIYNQVVGQMNFDLGAAVGIMLLLPTVLAFYLERTAAQRQAGTVSESAVPLVPRWSPKRDVPMALGAGLVALLPVATVGVVVLASFVRLWPYRLEPTLRHYDVKVAGGYEPLWTTVQVSLATGLVGALLLFALAVALRRMPRRVAKLTYLACLLPAAVPGLVLGLAYILAFNVPGTPVYALYGTASLIAACNVVHFATQGFLATMTGLRQVPAAVEESAACLGARVHRLVLDVVGPLVLPTLVSVFFFLFMQSMVTLSAVIFLVTPAVSVASVSIMRLEEAGFTSQAAAYATCTMALVVLAAACMRLALRRLTRRSV